MYTPTTRSALRVYRALKGGASIESIASTYVSGVVCVATAFVLYLIVSEVIAFLLHK